MFLPHHLCVARPTLRMQRRLLELLLPDKSVLLEKHKPRAPGAAESVREAAGPCETDKLA